MARWPSYGEIERSPLDEPTGPVHTKPDFIVCGGPLPEGGVCLYASRNLKRAKMTETSEYEDLPPWYFGPRPESSHNIEMSADMHDYVVIAAPTYPEAWQHLFEYWAEEDRRNGEIGLGTPVPPKAIDT